MISGTVKPASANLSMMDDTSSIGIHSKSAKIGGHMIMLNRTRGPRNSVIRCGTERWGAAVVKFKARSTGAVGSPDSCSKVDTK